MNQSFGVLATCLIVSGIAMATGVHKKDRGAQKPPEISSRKNQSDPSKSDTDKSKQ